MSILSNYHNLEKFAGQDMVRQINNERLRTINPCPLLCQSAVRKLLLEVAAKERPFHKFTRVSGETMIRLNEIVRAAAIGHVKQLPSKGKTI